MKKPSKKLHPYSEAGRRLWAALTSYRAGYAGVDSTLKQLPKEESSGWWAEQAELLDRQQAFNREINAKAYTPATMPPEIKTRFMANYLGDLLLKHAAGIAPIPVEGDNVAAWAQALVRWMDDMNHKRGAHLMAPGTGSEHQAGYIIGLVSLPDELIEELDTRWRQALDDVLGAPVPHRPEIKGVQ